MRLAALAARVARLAEARAESRLRIARGITTARPDLLWPLFTTRKR